MERSAKIYIAGHRGLVGSALMRVLTAKGYTNLLTRTHAELDLTDQAAVRTFFEAERPGYVFLAAAKVGGILANDTYPAEFIHQNLAIQTNVIHEAWRAGVKRLLFLGSSCIYPRDCPQPIKEEYLLTGPLEPTNRPYAIAKIAGIEMCWAYNRQYGTQFLAVMPTNLYGPGDNYDLETSHVIPAMLRKFHLTKLAAQGDWPGIEADECRHGPIPALLRRELRAICAGRLAPPRHPLGHRHPAAGIHVFGRHGRGLRFPHESSGRAVRAAARAGAQRRPAAPRQHRGGRGRADPRVGTDGQKDCRLRGESRVRRDETGWSAKEANGCLAPESSRLVAAGGAKERASLAVYLILKNPVEQYQGQVEGHLTAGQRP